MRQDVTWRRVHVHLGYRRQRRPSHRLELLQGLGGFPCELPVFSRSHAEIGPAAVLPRNSTQTIELFGRNANLLFEAPYSWGTTRGILNDIEARADFAGLNDLSATL